MNLTNRLLPANEACTRYSEDKVSAAKGGYIGFFGINRYEPAFENAAFALERDGQVSDLIGLVTVRRAPSICC